MTENLPGISREKEQQALDSAGFRNVADWLDEIGADATYNKYHMFSKIIKIDFDRQQEMITKLQNGLEAFNALEDSIDEFTTDWPP